MKIWAFTLALSLFIGCKNQTMSSVTLQDLKGNPIVLKDIQKGAYALYFFLSPQCPLSENYTSTINHIYHFIDSAKANISISIIFPGNFYTLKEVAHFVYAYKIEPAIFLDLNKVLTNKLHATITPEVFLLNDKEKILYSGAIDNWIVDLGTKRQIISENYVLDAIHAILKNKTIELHKTEAVGCFIE